MQTFQLCTLPHGNCVSKVSRSFRGYSIIMLESLNQFINRSRRRKLTKKLLIGLLFAVILLISASPHTSVAHAKESALTNAVVPQQADRVQVNIINIDDPNAVTDYASKAGVNIGEA